MTPALGEFSSAVVATFVVGSGSVGGLWWLWRVRAIAVKTRDDLKAHIVHQKEAAVAAAAQAEKDAAVVERRLHKVETAAASVQSLADAVKFAAETTAAQLGNLADRISDHASYSKDQFSDLREQQKELRLAMERRNSRGTQD